MDYQQTYIPHEYLELRMPAGKDPKGDPIFLLDPNHLHIWPRHSFMLIALPNKVITLIVLWAKETWTYFIQDKSFTCTLFAPTADFEKLSDAREALKWFGQQFPDALPLIGEKSVFDSFQNNPRSALIAVKVLFPQSYVILKLTNEIWFI